MSDRQKENNARIYLSTLVRGLRHLFLHNGWLKAIAVLISVFLWAGLISQDESVTRDKTFQNVSVSVLGTETMKNNSYIVTSDLDEMLNDVSIVAAVPQKNYENAEASVYNARLDLSRVKGTGEQEVKIQTTNSTTYGRVTSINPSSLTVNVEEYIIRQRIPVSAPVEGNIPEGWYMSKPTVDPLLVAVSGPRSLVETISKAVAYIYTNDIEWKESTIVTSAKIRLYNRAGEEVNSPLVSTTSSSLTIDSVVVEMNVMPSISFSTEGVVQLTGTVADGYLIKDVRTSPEIISIAAREEVLKQIEGLPLERSTVNVTDLTETTVFQLKVQKPSDETVLSNETITVTVEIETAEQP